jgi:hypothetical protein
MQSPDEDDELMSDQEDISASDASEANGEI